MIGANPKVSVAIWTCDQEAFIGDAITSALEQDYPDLEIVVADDASRDATPRIVSEFARRFPAVRAAAPPYRRQVDRRERQSRPRCVLRRAGGDS